MAGTTARFTLDASGLSGIGPVVVGIRDMATAGPPMATAEALAATLNSYSEVVHVLPEAPPGTPDQHTQAGTAHVLHGDPGRALLDHLATPGRLHSVLILDRTHRRGKPALGRTTRTLLTHCQVPMFWRP